MIESEKIGKMSNIVDNLIKALQGEFNKIKPRILVVGIVGGVYPSDVHGDIDIFTVLARDKEEPKELAFRHSQLISILQRVGDTIAKEGGSLITFTEFRMEEFSRYTSIHNRKSGKNLFIHLKVYPTPSEIRYWQNSAVAKGYFKNIFKILYEYGNGVSYLNKVIDSLPEPSLHERLEFLRSLFYETYEYLKLSRMPRKLLKYEGFNKLAYIVKYLSIELLNQKEYCVKAQMTWKEVYKSRAKLPNPVRNCIEFIDRNLNATKLDFPVSVLRQYFKDTHTIMDSCCYSLGGCR